MKFSKKTAFAFIATTIFAVTPNLAHAEIVGDPEKGAKVFKKCMACHAVVGKNKVGPALNGIVGAPAASVEGFKYSKAMMAAAEEGLVWDTATLSNYLENPRKAIKGNRMAFVGLKKPQDQADVIAYIEAESE